MYWYPTNDIDKDQSKKHRHLTMQPEGDKQIVCVVS